MKKIYISFFLVYLTYSTALSQQFRVSYSSSVFNEPFTGNVFLLLSTNNKNPKDAEIGLELFSCYSVFKKNVKPQSIVMIDDEAISYPVKLSDLERGVYYVQAIWDRNLGGRSITTSPGNIFSSPVKVTFTKNTKKIFTLNCDQVIPSEIFTETELMKELKVSSVLLTNFYKRPVTIDAAVYLPKEYLTEPNRKFPVLFIIFGYGNDYHEYSGRIDSTISPIDTTACIRVFLDGNCPLGHSVYANSENNGPWAMPLLKNLSPCLKNNTDAMGLDY